MKTVIALSFFMILGNVVSAQNLLGEKEDYIREYVKKNNPELYIVEDLNNDRYKYLKYEDNDGTMTAMFFLSDEERCTSIRKIYVHALRDEVTAELNKEYKKTGEFEWEDKKKGKEAVIKIEIEDWFFTVSIKPKNKE